MPRLCSFLPVLSLVQFRRTLFSYFLQDVISGAGAVRGVEGLPLRAHSIRGVSTSAVFLQNGRFLGNWRPQLGNRIQFLPLFIFVLFNMFLKGCGTLVCSSLWVLSLILHNFRALFWGGGSWVFAFLSGIRILGTRLGSTHSSWVGSVPGV